MTDWIDLSARASLASHRLIGWIYWDPVAIEAYAQLGIENGFGYYIATRGGPLAPAGHQAVAAAFYSIPPGFVQISLEMAAAAATWQQVTDARNHGVAEGLRAYAPELCDGLASLRDPLWEAADALSSSGRILFAAHRQWQRPDDPLVSAWLAVNCIREFRGDTHFAVLASEDLTGPQAGLLHDAFLNYPGDWIPRSRGADDAALALAFEQLEGRGLASNGVVNRAGLALRQRVETRTDELCEKAWRLLGEERTLQFIEMVEPFGQRFLDRVDATAGPNWMPAARDRRAPS